MFGRLSQHSTRALSGVSSSSSSLVSPPPFLSSSLGGKGERFLSNQGGVPDKARVVVIGGGIIGNSVAYHLAKMVCSVFFWFLVTMERLCLNFFSGMGERCCSS